MYQSDRSIADMRAIAASATARRLLVTSVVARLPLAMLMSG
jgi:hypothetical protein